jgi:hypothetical protein
METKNIFQIIAEGIGNTNQNVVDLYALVKEIKTKVDEMHDVLFPPTMSNTEPKAPATNEDGDEK